MKLVAPLLSTLALVNGFTMTCNDDKTITVDIAYTGAAEVLSLTYGTCDADNENVRITETTDEDGNDSFSIVMDIEACEADRDLRALEYNQDATIVVGRTGEDGQELKLAEYVVDGYCSFTDTYTATYSYGSITTDSDSFDQTGGNREIGFSITAYDSAFENALADEDKVQLSGATISLLVDVAAAFSDDFEYDTKTFVPTDCVISDNAETPNTYTLFDAVSDTQVCANTPVDLTIAKVGNQWQITHTVFQFQTAASDATYELTCNIQVCDVDRTTDCDAVEACLTPTL